MYQSHGKIMSVEEAVNFINDGDTILIGGNFYFGLPDKVLEVLERKFLDTGHPRDLTEVHATSPDVSFFEENTGIERFSHKGFLKKMICSTTGVGRNKKIGRAISQDQFEAYNLSLGTWVHLIEAIAGGKPGVITPVGIGTYMDPRIEGGKINQVSKINMGEVIELAGDEYLFFKAFRIDVAIIRGTTADENGNVTMEYEPQTLDAFNRALAAKSSGGKTIVQVSRIAEKGSLNPKSVQIPGNLVDAIVLQDFPRGYEKLTPNQLESFCGNIKLPQNQLSRKDIKSISDQIILHRAISELKPDSEVNLGWGIPVELPSILEKRNPSYPVIFSTEHGSLGGYPAESKAFGCAYNPDIIIEPSAMFRYYLGMGIDIAFLGVVNIDKNGNVNSTKIGHLYNGSGGFLDISHAAAKIVFCTGFSAGGLKTTFEKGKLKIVQEGKHIKFTDNVDHLSFSSRKAIGRKQEVLYITERAVFKLQNGKLTLTEVAPGIDMQDDILKKLPFQPAISDKLRQMDDGIFQSITENK